MLNNKLSILSLMLAVSALSSTATMAEKKFYVGTQLGVGINNLNDDGRYNSFVESLDLILHDHKISKSKKNHGFAGRLYAGYQFTRFLGLEAGYAKYSNAHLTKNISFIHFPGFDIKTKSKNRTSAIDLLAVLTMPVTNTHITFNAKAGVAYILNRYQKRYELDDNYSNAISGKPWEPYYNKIDFKTKKFRPKFAVGIDYNFNDRIALGLAYDITLGRGQPLNHHAVGHDDAVDGLDSGEEIYKNYSPKLQLISVNLKVSF